MFVIMLLVMSIGSCCCCWCWCCCCGSDGSCSCLPRLPRPRRLSLSHCVFGSAVCSSRGQSDSFIHSFAWQLLAGNINVDYMPTVCT